MSIFYKESRLYEKVMHIARIGSTEFEIIYIYIYNFYNARTQYNFPEETLFINL